MKKSTYILLILGCLLLGCALESKFALPKSETIDPALLGGWVFISEDGSEEHILIETLDDMTYRITFDNDVLLAHTVTIKGHHVMNLFDKENEDKPNVFYGFILKKNKLQIMEVTDKLTEGDFNSQKELIEFFETNIDRPDFFVNPDILKRKKDDM